MLILTIRTDKPEAEVGLYDDEKELVYDKWQAHRELAETLHVQIAKNLQFVIKEWSDIEGVVVFAGPGSFTGLRIGIATANALAYGLEIPIIGASGDDWLQTGIQQVLGGKSDTQVLPEYGAEPHITKPKK